MKKTIATLTILCAFLGAMGQDYEHEQIHTLFGDRHITHGGYGAVGLMYGIIDGKDALVMSGRGSWVIGHAFALGIGGTGFLNDFTRTTDNYVNLAGGYGGLVLEPIILPRFPVHISLPVLTGVGGVAYASYDPYLWPDGSPVVEDSCPFLIIEPGAELELNIVRFFRISMGAYYRYTSRITLIDTPSDVLNGLSMGVTFKFGKF